jgi:hypothetical protein
MLKNISREHAKRYYCSDNIRPTDRYIVVDMLSLLGAGPTEKEAVANATETLALCGESLGEHKVLKLDCSM